MSVFIIPLIAYLIGGFPTGVILSRWLFHRDIRQFGSGNMGAINVWRVFGLRWGLIVITVDIGKAYIAAALLPRWFLEGASPGFAAFCGLMATAGHIWSPFTHFRGGKGVGAALGAGLALYPKMALICFCIWALVVLITRYASLGALAAVVSYPILIYWNEDPSMSELGSLMTLMLLILFAHRDNWRRLWLGSELKIGHRQYINAADK